MTRYLLLLLGLLLWTGCPSGDDDDSSVTDDDDATQDDDDSGAPDDDDSVVPDDDDVAPDDDDSAQPDDDDVAPDDDDSSGDDDDSAQADMCSPDALLPAQAPCQPLASTVLALDDLAWNCPEGEYEFVTQADWDTFLVSTCGALLSVDPLDGFDWTTSNVVGAIQGSSGCDFAAGFHWIAQCADGSYHFADWMIGCGECDGYYMAAHFVQVDPLFTGFSYTGCVPEEDWCDDPVDGK